MQGESVPATEERPVALAERVTPVPPVAQPRRRTVRRVLLILAVILLPWWVSGYFIAYTDDSYLTSDWVEIAAEVSGPVVAVDVHDNQVVTRGTRLFGIDPVPFRLDVTQAEAAVAEAEAQIPVDHALLAAALASQEAAAAAQLLARQTEDRIRALANAQFNSIQQLDDATAQRREADAHVQSAAAEVLRIRETTRLHEAAVTTAHAALATAQWRLDRTDVRAPVDGPVANLRLRIGDMAVAHVPVLGIVDAQAWRVVSNYKEYVLRHLPPGTQVWVWLDAAPWHLYRGHVEGISHAISRTADAPGLLPYVEPTVNWIRLARRVPVRIQLDDAPPGQYLYMGSDARTLALF